MLKNMFKRSWLSVRRKFSRSLLLLIILFVMANLVLAAITIKSATNSSMEFAKNSLGGEVSLEPDMEKMRSNVQGSAPSDESSTGSQNTTKKPAFTRPGVSKIIADSIAESDYIKDYSYSLSARVNVPDGITKVESSNSSNSQMGGQMMRPGSSDSDEEQLSISGVNSYAYIPSVVNNEMKISSGKYFDEDTGTGVMISYDLADENGLKVGDKITLKNSDKNTNIEVEIIGIYDSTSDFQDANTIYTNIETTSKFLSSEDYNDGDFMVSSVTYYLNNSENSDAFIAEASKKFPNMADENLKIGIDDQAYKQMVEPIEQVGKFADITLIVVILASVLIIGLLIILNVKDRRYEIGVLLSLGASKMNVAGQILTEIVIIGTVAFGISIFTSGILAQTLGDSMLKNQIESSQKQSEENFGRPSGGMMRGGPSRNQNSNSENAISDISVNASIQDYLMVFGIGYTIIFVSVLAGTVNIFKLKPKEILSGKE